MCETKENPLGTERVGRLLRSYAIPGIISIVINSLYNMVDQIFIGQGVGMLGHGATNIIAPISTIAIALSSLFSTTENILPYALDYGGIIAVGFPFVIVTY